jgi:hypothetical protein
MKKTTRWSSRASARLARTLAPGASAGVETNSEPANKRLHATCGLDTPSAANASGYSTIENDLKCNS